MASLLNKRYVYNPRTKQMEIVSFVPRARTHDIMGDLADFVSPIDGKVVHGRRGLREHFKRYGVTNISDFKNQWERFQNQRTEVMQGRQRSNRERIEQTIRAFDDLRSGRANKRVNPWNK